MTHDTSRPSQNSICWAIPKLPTTAGARLLLFACWYCESNGQFHEVTASNATLAEWAGLSERTVRSAKKTLAAQRWFEFIYKSKGKADATGHQTDIFVVRWQKIFDDANTSYRERTERRKLAARTIDQASGGDRPLLEPFHRDKGESPPP